MSIGSRTLDRSGPRLNAVASFRLMLASGRIRGPLHGIPVLLKDNFLTEDGMTATAGAAALLKFRPKREATVVQRLREAGALILGKTNLTEFADYVSDVMPSGFSGVAGMVKNPHGKTDYGRGLGSSVGSAAAVAASLTPVALGSETQNSIQTPARVSSVFLLRRRPPAPDLCHRAHGRFHDRGSNRPADPKNSATRS
jgi:Asp-tRNA(Asn)/Glu-tRNA(Gln) amidotransferase A subunit family amidase